MSDRPKGIDALGDFWAERYGISKEAGRRLAQDRMMGEVEDEAQIGDMWYQWQETIENLTDEKLISESLGKRMLDTEIEEMDYWYSTWLEGSPVMQKERAELAEDRRKEAIAWGIIPDDC